MYKGIEKGFGERIGNLDVSLPQPAVSDGLVRKKVRTEVEGGETEMVFPIYGRVDFIDTFGIPPFNEWAMGVDVFEESEISFHDQETDLKENYECQTYTDNIASIKLERQLGDLKEKYRAEEMILPYYNASVGRFNISHSNGQLQTLIERDVAKDRFEMERVEGKLPDKQKSYMEKIRREEGLPDIMIAKCIRLEGRTPAVQEKLLPFWDKKTFDQEIRVIEIGYFKHGQNETEFDKRHGRWYKLFSFEDFDYNHLEIREGNWESKELELDGEKKRFMSNYEKYLYNCSDKV